MKAAPWRQNECSSRMKDRSSTLETVPVWGVPQLQLDGLWLVYFMDIQRHPMKMEDKIGGSTIF